MFRCKLCDVSVSGRRNFEMHLSGKKHRLRMHLASDNGDDEFSDAESFKPWSQDFEVPDIAPGEPIPPGLEDIVENLSHAHDDENVQTAKAVIEDLPDPEDYGDKVCQIQDQLDAHGATLIGLDFLVEATIRDGPEKLEYFCLLCDKKGPKRIAISHVMTFNHQLKYLKAIFPTLTRHVSKRCTAQTPKSVVSAIVNKVCTKIESVIGRFKPPVVDRDILVESKSQYTELIIQKHASRVKDMKVKELIEIVNKGADKHESKKEAEGEGRKDSEKKDGDEQLLTNKADEDSDDIEVLSVVSKVKLLVDITKEDEDGSTEKKESVKDDISGAAKERKESSQAGGSNHTGESKGGHLRRSLSNLSSISSISSPERSMVEIPRSPRSNMERRLPRRYSPGRPRKSFHQNPAHRSTYIRGRYMDRIPRRPRSGTRSKSRSISRSRSRSISPARSSKSSSGSRSYSMARNRAVLRRINRLRSRSPIRLRSRSPIILRSRSPLRLRSRSPIRLRSRSPIRLRSRSPIRLRSRSPVRLRSRSPMKRRSRSPLRLRSRSPIRLRSRSPLKLRSRSPIRLRSRSPIRLRSRSPIRLSVSPKRNPRRHGSPRLSPSRYRDRQRSKGLPVKGDAERRNRGGHIDDRSGKSDPHTKPEFQVSVWEKFRIEADELEIEMAASRRRYERSPEKHPRYAAEWKLFYSRRMEEAKGHRNLDPRSEEFKLEWIGFWGEKMNDLLNQEFRERKDAIRKRLGLPDEPPPYELKKRYEKRPPPIEAEDDWIPPPPRRLTDRVSPSMPEPLPISTERKPVTVSDLRSTWRALTGGNIEANVLPRNPNAEFEEHWCDSDVGLIPTLRIISALEEQLGSLGPRVNSHLSSALALQRGGGSLIPLIYSSDIIVLFETVKEKLLGQLQTGIVRKTMVSAVENAICSISNLLEKASRYRYPIKSEKVDGTISGSPFDFDSAPRMQPQLKEAIESFTDRLILASSQKASMISKPEPVEDAASVSIKPESVESAPVVIPGIGEVNKDAIAQHIAMALIERGRTDVTETELLRLIEEVVGLAQAQVPEDTAPREGCMSSQEDFYRNAVEGQGAGGNSSLNDLMARVCDRACMSENTPSQPLDDQGEPKYSLIAVDLDDDPCQKMYQKVSGETVLTTQDQQGSEGRAEPGEIKSLLRRFHYLTEDEQVSIAKYIKDHEAELPEEFDLLNRMLMHRGPVEELEKEKSSFPLGSPSDRRNNSSPVVETSAARAVPDELGEFMTPDSSALEMRLGLGNQGESLASMKRDDMDLAREANHGRNTPRTSLNEQYNDEQFRERSYSHGSAQGNYNYSRDEDPRHQLASNHSGDYVQPQSLPYDDRDYINMHGSGNGRRQEAMPEVSETSYRDYYRERSHSDVYDVQDNLNPNIRMRQYHDGGNPDPVQDYNERLYYQQQMALNSDFGGRDPRNYRNYPSGDYYDY